MTINRKLFWRTLAVLVIVESCFLLAGCGDWESQAIQIIQMLNPAIVAVLNILAALGVSVSPSFMTVFTEWSNQAQAALAEVKALIAQYKTAAAADQPGILNKVQTLLSTIQSNLQTLLPQLHIDNATNQARVAAALSAIIGFVTAIQGLLPAVTTATTRAQAVAVHGEAKTAVSTFKKEFNDAVEPFGEEYVLQ